MDWKVFFLGDHVILKCFFVEIEGIIFSFSENVCDFLNVLINSFDELNNLEDEVVELERLFEMLSFCNS